MKSTPLLSILEAELSFTPLHGRGPGGQNINKVSSAVQLRLDVRNSPSLGIEIKEKLARAAGRRMSADGMLLIEARRFRERERNRQDALDRLAGLLEKAMTVTVPRRPTRPGPAARAQRLQQKRRHSAVKERRRSSPALED